jgi:hypothetical protein
MDRVRAVGGRLLELTDRAAYRVGRVGRCGAFEEAEQFDGEG